MAGKKDKQKQRGRQTQNSKGVNWDLVWKVLASVFAFAGSLATVYDLVGKIRSDTQTFYAFILPVLVVIVWVAILVQLIRKKNPYVILLLAVTVLGGVIGGVGWQSYNKTQEDKVIILVAQFDGPEETYGLHDQIMEDLHQATKGYSDTVIIDGEEAVTSGQGTEYARKLGKKANADLVIWAWYRPTENPNITIHIENLSPTQIKPLQESETYQPQATLAELNSFEIQRKLGSETSTLINFLTGLLRFEVGNYDIALERFEQILIEKDISTYIDPESLYLYIAASHLYMNKFDDAIRDINKVLELDPKLAIAYTDRGIAYEALGQAELAFSDYNKAIELDAYYNRGLIRGANLGQYELAVQDFTKAIQLDANNVRAYVNRGNAYYYLRQYEPALVDYNTAIDLNPNNANAHKNRGSLYQELGRIAEAEKDFKKYEELTGQKP